GQRDEHDGEKSEDDEHVCTPVSFVRLSSLSSRISPQIVNPRRALTEASQLWQTGQSPPCRVANTHCGTAGACYNPPLFGLSSATWRPFFRQRMSACHGCDFVPVHLLLCQYS